MIELQLIDTNCNDCKFMLRNVYKKRYFDKFKEDIDRKVFSRELNKDLFVAYAERDNKALKKLLAKECKPTNVVPINYGYCKKKEIEVSFLPGTCCPQNSECFEHRKL
jgi:hypothetical protein